MYYEINVAHNGKHLFATHKRSITDSRKAAGMLKLFTEKFPTKDGFKVSLSSNPQVNEIYSLPTEALISEMTLEQLVDHLNS